MTRIWTKLFVVLVFAAPVGLIAGDKKELPERPVWDPDLKSTGAIRARGETQVWFAKARNGRLDLREYKLLVNRPPRKVTIEGGEKFVFATDAQVELEGFHFPAISAGEINPNSWQTIREIDVAKVEVEKKLVMK